MFALVSLVPACVYVSFIPLGLYKTIQNHNSWDTYLSPTASLCMCECVCLHATHLSKEQLLLQWDALISGEERAVASFTVIWYGYQKKGHLINQMDLLVLDHWLAGAPTIFKKRYEGWKTTSVVMQTKNSPQRVSRPQRFQFREAYSWNRCTTSTCFYFWNANLIIFTFRMDMMHGNWYTVLIQHRMLDFQLHRGSRVCMGGTRHFSLLYENG